METYPTQIYRRSELDDPNNKENVVLRSLVPDSERHVPLVEHRSPSTVSVLDVPTASMYTVGTRYQSIPPKYLPKKTDPKVYFLDSRQAEELTPIDRKRETPPQYQSEKQYNEPVVFLEPKVMSQPVLYTLAGEKYTPAPVQPIIITKEPPSPTLYSLNSRPRTVDMGSNTLEGSTPIIDKSPTLYSWVGSSRLQNEISESPKQQLQPSPNIYSIIGSPARTSRGVQVGTSSPIQPVPILYTIVDDAPVSTKKTKETRPHSPPTAPKDAVVYTFDNESNARKQQQQQPTLIPPKDTVIYTVNNESNVRKQQQQQVIPTPTLYALVGKPLSPLPQDDRSKPPVRKKTPPPPPVTVTTHRSNHSLERKPDIITEEIITYPVIKTQRQSQPKESTVPKSELIIIPVNEERRSRPQLSREPLPSQTNIEPLHRRTAIVTHHSPNQFSNYQSPYTIRTHKPYREQKYITDNTLPAISTNRPEKKERPPLYEPRYRVERHHPYVATKPTSLERYPVNTNPRSSLWDNGYQTQTDDDEDYDQKLNKKNRTYKTSRPRAPWIPVW
ncbi:hypothetical protein I4U23_014307 [Adineta vaga]|nr:hypothetical protein I4U23_014307 [Adineta vaga]